MRISLNLVRVACIAGAALSLAACAPMAQVSTPPGPAAERSAPPPPSSRDLPLPKDVKLGARSRYGTAMLTDGIFHCADPKHPAIAKYPDCRGIPVIVLQTQQGCLSLIPYAALVIHSDRKKTKVIWQIYGPQGYEFASDGIQLSRLIGGTLNPGDVYANKQHQGDRYKWELKQDAIFPGGMAHDARVVDPSGTPCEPIDPVAINIID
jgi:hypothetical protein